MIREPSPRRGRVLSCLGMSRSLALLVALAVLVPAPGASAANGLKPRVPVIWTAGECATIVDQQAAPILHLEYSVLAEEDPDDRTPDEVDDSRTHQFLAFAKQDFHKDPPLWIARADIQRAAMVDDTVHESDVDREAILEETTRFAADEWIRVTPDDARAPITFAQAAMGVDWDTTGVAPGTYQVAGYTWEPLGNLWARRPGFVKVIASTADAAAAGPSIALLRDDVAIVAGTPHTLRGCADVAQGTTVTVEWGESIGTIEPEWQNVVEDEPIETGPLTIAVDLPDEAGGKSVRLRAIVTDADGRTYTAFTPEVVAVGANPNPASDDGGSERCAVGGSAGSIAWWLILLGLRIGRRRRETAA